MLTLAFLTVAALAEHARPPPAGMIPLTCNEIAHLTGLITGPDRDAGRRLRWSAWRRRHQHCAAPATTGGMPPTTPSDS